MIGAVADSVGGVDSGMGSIEVDATLGNLETLVTKMSEYQTQASSLEAL
jgi:hypothetical protein